MPLRARQADTPPAPAKRKAPRQPPPSRRGAQRINLTDPDSRPVKTARASSRLYRPGGDTEEQVIVAADVITAQRARQLARCKAASELENAALRGSPRSPCRCRY